MHRWLIMSLALTLPSGGLFAGESPGLNLLVRLLSESDNAQLQQDILVGIAEGLEGRRRVDMPEAWPAASSKLQGSASGEVRDRAIQLALIFDDPNAIRLLRDRALNVEAAAAESLGGAEPGRELRWMLLTILILVLIGEQLLSLRMSHHPEVRA